MCVGCGWSGACLNPMAVQHPFPAACATGMGCLPRHPRHPPSNPRTQRNFGTVQLASSTPHDVEQTIGDWLDPWGLLGLLPSCAAAHFASAVTCGALLSRWQLVQLECCCCLGCSGKEPQVSKTL